MLDCKLNPEDRRLKQQGREAYIQGKTIGRQVSIMEGAGWLEAAMADPTSYMNLTDVDVGERIPTLSLKPDAPIPPAIKGARGRPLGCKDRVKRKRKKTLTR